MDMFHLSSREVARIQDQVAPLLGKGQQYSSLPRRSSSLASLVEHITCGECRDVIRTVGCAFTSSTPSWGYPTALKVMIVHLRGRPSEEWLASPETALDGAARAEAQLEPARASRMPCSLQLRPTRLAAFQKASDGSRYGLYRLVDFPGFPPVPWPPALPVSRRADARHLFWSSLISSESSSEFNGVRGLGEPCEDVNSVEPFGWETANLTAALMAFA
jgi:hypothetical protein